MFELFQQCVFFHYISLFYIFFSLVDICVYFRIIASSSNFSFHFVVSACDFQFVFTLICFVGFMFYLLFVLIFRYTVILGFVCWIFHFLCSILYIIVVPFVFVFSVIVLPVVLHLRFRMTSLVSSNFTCDRRTVSCVWTYICYLYNVDDNGKIIFPLLI